MAEVIDRAEVDAALKNLTEMIANDGYLLRWEPSDGDTIVITIDAGPEACADCLVPLVVMEAIMSNALEGTRYSLDHVVMPEGEAH
jgi:hypothetical protein